MGKAVDGIHRFSLASTMMSDNPDQPTSENPKEADADQIRQNIVEIHVRDALYLLALGRESEAKITLSAALGEGSSAILEDAKEHFKDVISILFHEEFKFPALIERYFAAPDFSPRTESEISAQEAEAAGTHWVVDRIKPVSSFDLTDSEQASECFQLANTKPVGV